MSDHNNEEKWRGGWMISGKCELHGHTYGREINQEYPRKCKICEKEEILEAFLVNGEIVDEKTFRLAKKIQHLEQQNKKLLECLLELYEKTDCDMDLLDLYNKIELILGIEQ